MTSGPAAPLSGRGASALRWMGFAAGSLLLMAAVVAVLRRPADFTDAMHAARAAPVWLIATAVLLPCLNWLNMSAVFWLLTARRAPGRVRPGEMLALIGSAWLLNYVPMRPGLFGRVALHRSLHAIPVRDSAMVVAENIACGGVAILLALCAVITLQFVPSQWMLASLCLAMLAPTTCGLLVLRGRWRTWSIATLLRNVDLLLWAARYAAAAAMIGRPLTLPEAVAFAVVSQIAMLVPLAGNGLGLREWAIGLTAASLPAAWAADAHAMTSASGLVLDLLNRVAEIAAALPVGLVCSALVARLVARRVAHHPAGDLPSVG